MRQFLLAVVLVLAPVGAFFGVRGWLYLTPVQAAVAGPSLGDLQPMEAIVSDVQASVSSGDLVAAGVRITDLETAWDDAEATMRPKNPEAWGRVDDAIDAALSALRAGTPAAATVKAALDKLVVSLADPTSADQAGELVEVGGIAVTDASGHPLPCEAMLGAVKDRVASGKAPADPAALDDLIAKATERCNADDDRNANQFSAKALGLLKV